MRLYTAPTYLPAWRAGFRVGMGAALRLPPCARASLFTRRVRGAKDSSGAWGVCEDELCIRPSIPSVCLEGSPPGKLGWWVGGSAGEIGLIEQAVAVIDEESKETDPND